MKAQINTELLDELTRSKIRVNYANAEKNELKNAVMKGDLIPIDQVKAKWAEDALNVKNKFLALPDKLSPRLSGQVLERNVVYALLKEAVDEILLDLADEYHE